jgi:hypothetical protein
MKLGRMGFGLPDMGQLRSMFDEKFEQLLDELRAIRAVLEQIRDRNAPPV